MFLLDMGFFFIFVFMTVGIIFCHRSNATRDTSRKGAVDGTYWGQYATAATPVTANPPKPDHGPKVVNGKLVLPKVLKGSASALAGKSTYGGKR
jgi:hypothetical protein